MSINELRAELSLPELTMKYEEAGRVEVYITRIGGAEIVVEAGHDKSYVAAAIRKAMETPA